MGTVDADITQVQPQRVVGAPTMVQSSKFLSRLISNQIELKSCMESDVSAAQSDIRYLTAEQLLAIRVPTMELATESHSHSARNSFLEMVDKHLFSKLARHCLRSSAASDAAAPA